MLPTVVPGIAILPNGAFPRPIRRLAFPGILAIRLTRPRLFSVSCIVLYLRVLAIRFLRLELRGPVGMMNHVRRRFDELAVGVELRKKFDSADDCVGCNFDRHGMLDDGRQREANGVGAAVEESCGVGVAVDRRVVGDAVVLGDLVGATPAQEVLLDGFAVGMATDFAFATVPRGSRPARFRPSGTAARSGALNFVTVPGEPFDCSLYCRPLSHIRPR